MGMTVGPILFIVIILLAARIYSFPRTRGSLFGGG
jgi:hypothetical protein